MEANPCLVITSIAAPTVALRSLAAAARLNAVDFILIGDEASPGSFELDGCDYYSLERQRRLHFELATICPARHYARKNIGYLLAAQRGAPMIVETDDDSVKAWVFVGIINGLEEMFRIKVPVLDVFGSRDWDVTRWGAEERRAQILKIAGSEQVIVPDAQHFFEGREDVLVKTIDAFLRKVLR